MKRSIWIITTCTMMILWGLGSQEIRACQADFNYSIHKLTATFSYATTKNVQTTWTINEETVKLKDAAHKFKKTGTYKVCRTVSNPDTNCKSQHCKNLAIGLACDKLSANFEVKNTGYLSQFILPTDTYEAIQWDFGDGNTSNKLNPTHQYKASGTYEVSVKVKNGDCNKSFSEEVRIKDERVSCEAEGSKYVVIHKIWQGCGEQNADNEAIQFVVANQVIEIEKMKITWSSKAKWQGICSDEATEKTLEAINKTIKKGGQLLAPKNGYLPAYAEVVLFTSPNFDHSNFDFSTLDHKVYALFQCGGNTISHFINPTNKKRKAANQSISIKIDKNKVEKLHFDGTTFDGATNNVLHFDLVGNLSKQEKNCTFFDTKQVSLQLPSFDIAQKGLEIQLLNTSSVAYKSSLWELGNNSFQILNHPTYTYSDAGTYTVALVLELEDGSCIKIDEEIEVGSCDIEADFTFTTDGNSVELVNLSDGDYDALWWSMGEGNKVIRDKEQFNHHYDSKGTFKVCLTTQSAATGCEDQLCKRVEILAEGEEASATEQETETCDIEVGFDYSVDGLTVQFNNASIGHYDSLLWDFGDGNSSTKENPTYTYQKGGEYFFTLTALKNNDESCTKTFKGFVNVFE